MISARLQRLKYIAGDYISSNIAMLLYNCARFYFGENRILSQGFTSLGSFLSSENVILGQLLFPIAMMGIYYLSGYYTEAFRKSRMQELVQTLTSSFVSALMVFFIAIINDLVSERTYSYELILLFLVINFVTVYTFRLTTTSIASKKIMCGEWKFNTLIIGAGKKAVNFANKMANSPNNLGYNIVGMVAIPGEQVTVNARYPVYLISDIADVCARCDIKELIVIPPRHDAKMILNTVNTLFPLNLPVKIMPDIYNILVSRVRLSDFHGEPLVDISGSNMGHGAANAKRVIDCLLASLSLIILAPFLIFIAFRIKTESKGGIIYKQERIGLRNKAFIIYKFRTMYPNAEEGGIPRLSSGDNDSRITPFGKFMRKYRIDELPQFWNVLKGDMSIVGPRPERQYYIDQIIKKAPSYTLLHQVRPGITSMGMVKFGYAKNVEEMIERMKYDLIYLENMSLLNDLKIMAYTVETVITGRGI